MAGDEDEFLNALGVTAKQSADVEREVILRATVQPAAAEDAAEEEDASPPQSAAVVRRTRSAAAAPAGAHSPFFSAAS